VGLWPLVAHSAITLYDVRHPNTTGPGSQARTERPTPSRRVRQRRYMPRSGGVRSTLGRKKGEAPVGSRSLAGRAVVRRRTAAPSNEGKVVDLESW
jgi:hypothetical protein